MQIVPPAGEETAFVSGDPVRLQQVFWNLFSNAVKFTPAGGTVTASVEKDRDEVRIRVSDTGIGISAAFLPLVFDRFSQSDGSHRRVHGGLGLGLAIVRHLTEMHGGSASANSAGEGRGATFVVRLPAVPVPAEKEQAGEGQGKEGLSVVGSTSDRPPEPARSGGRP